MNKLQQLLAAMLTSLATMPAGEERTKMEGKIAELKTEIDSLGGQAAGTSQNQPASGQQAGSATDIGQIVAKAVAEAMQPYESKITSLGSALQKEQEARETATNALEEERKTKRTGDIKTLVADAVKAGKIPNDEAKITEWTTRLTNGFDVAKPILDEMAGNPALARTEATKTGSGTGDGSAQQPANKFLRSIPESMRKYVDSTVAEAQ